MRGLILALILLNGVANAQPISPPQGGPGGAAILDSSGNLSGVLSVKPCSTCGVISSLPVLYSDDINTLVLNGTTDHTKPTAFVIEPTDPSTIVGGVLVNLALNRAQGANEEHLNFLTTSAGPYQIGQITTGTGAIHPVQFSIRAGVAPYAWTINTDGTSNFGTNVIFNAQTIFTNNNPMYFNDNSGVGHPAILSSPSGNMIIRSLGSLSPVEIQNSAGSALIDFYTSTTVFNNHLASTQASAPTLSSCGTSPTLTAQSTDVSGTITTGSSAITQCTVSFSTAYSTNPKIVVSAGSGTTPVAAYVGARNGASFVIILASALTSGTIDYMIQQ